jgi:hypothetical protein
MLHYVALAYPATPSHQHQLDYRAFVEGLQKVLPCRKCRDHMAAHLRAKPVAVPLSKGKSHFFDWTVELHNLVNATCGKPAYDAHVARFVYEQGYGCKGISLMAVLLYGGAAALVLAAAGAVVLAAASRRLKAR